MFTTLEAPDLGASIRVRTSAGDLVPFNRDRLFVDIAAALGHRKSHLDEASALCAEIIGQIVKNTPGAIVASYDIAIVAETALRRFDTTAGTYFAAYHPTRD
ncbi:hypothetical protein KDA14_02825 [Candidatus Saccharibacteria bacterium]|nr:hypothetical protein [Candidatus Saccharibacteria bacterium]